MKQIRQIASATDHNQLSGKINMKRCTMQPRRWVIALIILAVTWGDVSAQSISRENAVVRAVRNTSPAVVNISSEHEVRMRSNPFYGFGGDTFFDSFFRDFFDPGFERRYKRSSLGSGVIIDGKRGFILTNAHVVPSRTPSRSPWKMNGNFRRRSWAWTRIRTWRY